MREVQLKVVFSNGLEDRHKAVLPAISSRFKEFDLHVEGCMPAGISRHRIRGGLLVLRAAETPGTLDLDAGRAFGLSSYHHMAAQDFAVGITPYPLLVQYPSKRLIIPEVFEYYKASVISLATIRADSRRSPRIPDVDDAEAPRLVERVVSHAIGHVMIRPQKLDERGFCASAGCIMGRIDTILDLMKLPGEGADFCPSCREGIDDTVMSAKHYAMA